MSKEQEISEKELQKINRLSEAKDGQIYKVQIGGRYVYFIGNTSGKVNVLERLKGEVEGDHSQDSQIKSIGKWSKKEIIDLLDYLSELQKNNVLNKNGISRCEAISMSIVL